MWKEVIIICALIWSANSKNRYSNQARLYSEHGHLFIVGADHSNITLKTSGGFINVNDQDLLFITNMAKKSSEFVERFQTSILPQLQGLPGVNNELLEARLRRLEVALSGANSTGVDLYKSTKARLRILITRVNALSRIIRNLRMLLSADECESSPCQNGGTCTDMFNGFHCHCTPGWQGEICEKDVNECEDFAGTELGCRNGATCRNFKGSYACTCSPGWYGIHCTERTYDCSVQSSSELCGNGICVNQGGTGRGFVCICNEGWTRNAADGMCTVDKNECAGPHRPCSHDPPVECHNTLGSFTCGNCPRGYTGNGYHCTDIDECEVSNGGCSTSPMVDCINLRGSRRCGPCPPGFVGDGITCTQGGWCKSSKNNCHPLATCIENPGVSYIECRCPTGYTGSGVGPDGCVVSTSNTRCYFSPCSNGGTCIPIGTNEYKCKCTAGFKGTNCMETEGPCDSAPCKNGGSCESFFAGNRLISFHRCICPSGFTGTNCEIADEGCVASFSGLSGNVSYPSVNSSISVHLLTCGWTITTQLNKVINLTFTELNIYPVRRGSTCLINYVEVYDGRSSAFPQVGHFCGPELPPPIISTHPVLYVIAKMTPTQTTSLRFNWKSIDPHCGGEINATVHGVLSSPGSPGSYPKHLHCIWKLFTNPGQRIQITFFSFDLEKDATCNSDFLEIRSGDSDTSPLIRKLCTSTLPSPITTGTSVATIIFHSEGKGFQLTYAPKEGIPGCGGVFTTPRGQFKPPTNPGGTEYQEALSCEWLIELPQSEKIRATISSFTIEHSEACIYDSLAIYDGPTKNSGLIGRWCGQSTIPPITSTSNALLVVFNTDYTMNEVNEGGFVFDYTAVCGGTWTASEGVISSPYFPHHYPEDRTCVFVIERPLGYAIKVRFVEFDLEFSEDCIYDKLEIYDGNSENSPHIGQYCGNNKPGEIISTHNFLYMTLVTDSTGHGRGFQFNYTSLEISCGGILTEPSGTIKSPSYPDHYPPNQDCTWIIFTKPGTVIQLTWLAFHVSKSFLCNQDWVKIFDNNTISSFGGQLGDKYCSNTLPPAMTSTSNVMSVVFHADGKNSEPGFTASYTTVIAKDVCSGSYFTSAGHLSSPNFPNGYSNNLDCQWLISVPNGQQIRLTPVSFSLENSVGCRADYLQISNGGHDAAPIIDKFCGSNLNRTIISMTNQLFLRFVTDSEDSAPGFKLFWDGAQTGCGGHLTSSSGAIMSPNYPQPYGRNGVCTWTITVSEGSAIRLTFNDLDLEDHAHCSLDYLEVYDGKNSHGSKLAKVCSHENYPLAVSSKGNAMFIRFRSDPSRQGRGFHLKYKIACNITIKGYKGVIESPGFPNTEDVPRECVWEIDAPKGNKVNISFSHFEFEEERFGINVKGQYLNIYDGSISPSNLIGSYDYEVLPPRIKSSLSNHIFIHYNNPSSGLGLFVSKSVFRMEWIVSGCGGVFKKQKHGEISSPNYPKPYPHSTHCEWFIAVLPGNSIKITIDDLQVEDSTDCEYDALEVYGGPDESSPNLAKLCKKLGDKNPVILTTSGNEAFIRFRSDSSATGIGFHAVYDLTPSDCGGEFAAPYGSIHSHNYPQNYDEHDDCNFIIRVDAGHTVNLTFTDFDIDAVDRNCTNGFVKVYDGDSEEAPLLNSLCGNRLPPAIFSSSNTLFIRHKTDGFSVAKGFYANFQTACGAILETDSTDTLMFNERDSPFISNNEYNCTWIIRSKLPNSKMRLQFIMLEHNDVDSEAPQHPLNLSAPLPGLNILSGEGLDAPVYRHVSGNRIPPLIVVPSSVVTLLYNGVTIDSQPLRFVLDYSALNTACGGNIKADKGTIVSPGFADPFADATAAKQVECIWTLHVAPGNSMDLTFSKLNMLDSEPCNNDYVEIRTKNGAGHLIGTYCGTTVPATITANDSLWIKYKSASQDSIHGFEASFDLDTFNELQGFAGEIASPLYPLNYYLSTSYSWRVSVRAGHAIRIAFNDFYMESFTSEEGAWDECYNSLVIYDGFDDSASVSKSFCGLYLPEPFITDSNIIYIEMKHTYKGLATHFLLNWMQMQKTARNITAVSKGSNCTTYVELKKGSNSSSYTFKSPGFPNGYNNSLHCEWIFEAPVGNHVLIEFSTVNLESSRQCQYDSLTLYKGLNDGTGEWVQIDKICEDNATTVDYIGSRLTKVVFRTDHSVNKTGFLGRASIVCGGEINAPNGILSEGSHVMCEWNITVKPGRTIAVTLKMFLVRDTPPCSRNYLMLRDGKTVDSPMLGRGRYCGEAIVEIPETKSNHLYVMYRSGATEGFTLSFEEKSLSCGGTVFLTHDFKSTIVHSPNYPHIPPPHIECEWKIIGPSGESIHFEVHNKFDMSWSKGCKNEYVELREGSSEFGHFIGRYCSKTPSYITTDGNSLYIKYFNGVDAPHDGFNATVSISKCGGTIYTSGENGTIFSPGYPDAYEGNLNCTWKLVAPLSKLFSLNVNYSLGGRRRCNSSTQDTLSVTENIQDDIALEGPLSMVWCSQGQTSISSEINEIFIHFQSYSQPIHGSKRFFIIKYKEIPQECGGKISASTGIIKSPYYPTSYQGRIYCTWEITVPEGRRVTFTLIDLDMAEEQTRRTNVQFLGFYDGFSFNRIKRLSGAQNSTTIIESSGSKMKIIYRSFYKTTHRGFIGNFSSDKPAMCGGTVITNVKNGSLLVDKRLLQTNASFSCEWKVITPTTEPTTITFSFEGKLRTPLNYAPECEYLPSRLVISNAKSKKIAHFCSDTKPDSPYLVSTPNTVTEVKAVKDIWEAEFSNLNFTLNWKVDACGGYVVVSQTLTISSPGNDTYPSNIDCAWSLSSPEGSTIKVSFTRFDLGTDCLDDYLKVFNGPTPLSPVIIYQCGSIIPAEIISQSNNVWIHFHSGAPKSKKGFSLQVSQAVSSCGGVLHLRKGEVRSPNYPSNYDNDIECDWEIQAPQGYHVGLVFNGRFFIEHTDSCAKDFLEISEYINNEWRHIDRLCGRDLLVRTYNSTTNRMRVFFKTNSNVTGDGFNATFNWNCGGLIEVTGKGDLYSPGWPGLYQIDLYCNYTLLSPQGKTITLRTESFQLESASPNGCTYDFIQFFTQLRHYYTLKSNGIYCGRTMPPVQTSAKKMNITFKTDDFFNFQGFHFVYSIDTCGGEITEETVITDGSIGTQSEQTTHCIWNITAPENRVVQIKISELSFTKVFNCHLQSLTIYDTSNTSSNENGTLLGKVCGTIDKTPAFFRSSGRKMKLNLQSYYHNLKNPFTVGIHFQYGPNSGCGGEISVAKDESKILSPDINRDGNYDDELDCVWTVNTITGSTVLLSFESFNLKPCNTKDNSTNGTCCDVLEVYDGSSVNTQLIGRYCGSLIPRDISSSRNYLTLRFISDSEGNAAGFRAKVTSHQSACGQPVLTASIASQFLTTPNYPGNYSINIHCSWIISTNRFSSLHIRIEDLDIENSDDCSADRLEISDVSKLAWSVQPRGISSHLRNVYSGSGFSFRNRPMPYSHRQQGGLRPSWRNSFGDQSRNVYIGSSSLIQNGNRHPTPNVYKFCGKKNAVDLYATSNQFIVKFFSDSHIAAKGFNLSYNTAGCSRNYTEPQGRIHIARSKDNCVITITTQENSTISLYFISINMFKNPNGCSSKLSVFDGANKTAEICGYATPPPIFSSRNLVTLQISTNTSRFSYSFDLSYTTTDQGPGCGGTFYNSFGAFTSPSYPGNFRNSSYCCWNINIPLPNIVKVIFKDFDIGSKATCFTDYVQLFDVDPNTGERILRTTYCGGDKPADFIGTGQSVAICYKTSIHNSGIGWSALFSSYTENPNVPALLSVYHV